MTTDSIDRLLESWGAVRPDLDLSPVAIVARLGRLRRAIAAELETVYAEHGLTGADFSALVTLRRLGGSAVSQTELMRELGLTSGTVSVRVDRLVARGLAERRTDGRAARVSLTAAGADLFERVTPAHVAAEERLLAALDAGEREQLVALLRKLLVSFEGSAAGGDLPRLGAVLSPAHVTIAMRRAVGLPPVAGLLVREVEPDGPAAAAGLRTGDVLELRSIAELHAALREGRLEVGVVRGVERLRVTVPLARTRHNDCRPQEDDRARVRRQQKILSSIKDKVTSFETFIRLPWVSWAAPKAIRSDMSGPTLLGLIGAEMLGGNGKKQVLTPSGNVTLPDGGAGLTVDEATKQRIVDQFMKG